MIIARRTIEVSRAKKSTEVQFTSEQFTKIIALSTEEVEMTRVFIMFVLCVF